MYPHLRDWRGVGDAAMCMVLLMSVCINTTAFLFGGKASAAILPLTDRTKAVRTGHLISCEKKGKDRQERERERVRKREKE
jgi:hypothetical protein